MYSKSFRIISNIFKYHIPGLETEHNKQQNPALACHTPHQFWNKTGKQQNETRRNHLQGISALFMSQAIFRCKSNSNFTCQIWTNNTSETQSRLAFKSDAAWSLAIPEAWQLSWKAEINLWPGGCVWMKAKQLQVTWQDWNILNLKHPEISSGKAERNPKNAMPLFFSCRSMISN